MLFVKFFFILLLRAYAPPPSLYIPAPDRLFLPPFPVKIVRDFKDIERLTDNIVDHLVEILGPLMEGEPGRQDHAYQEGAHYKRKLI